MKTFRLRGLHLQVQKDKNELEEERVELQGGLVINREENGWWLVEAMVAESGVSTFQQLSDEASEVVMEVLISHTQNDPATMVGRVRSIRSLTDRYSILIDGKMAVKKEEVFNYILETLIEDGYSGDDLLTEFKRRKQDRGSWSRHLARSLYNQYRRQGYSPLDQAE